MDSILKFSVFLFFASWISISDVLLHKIRNLDLLYFALAGLIFCLNLPGALSFVDIGKVLSVLLIVAALTLGRVGAGDIKLFMALSFWNSYFDVWLDRFLMAWIYGGIYALSYYLFNRKNIEKVDFAFAPIIFLAFLPI